MGSHPVRQSVDPGQTWFFVLPLQLDQPAVAGSGVLFFHLIGILNEILLDASAAVLHVGPGCPGKIVVPRAPLGRPRVSPAGTTASVPGPIGPGAGHGLIQPGVVGLPHFLLALGLAHQVVHLVECLHAGLDGRILKYPLHRNLVPVGALHVIQLLLLFHPSSHRGNAGHSKARQGNSFDNGFLHLVAEFVPKSHLAVSFILPKKYHGNQGNYNKFTAAIHLIRHIMQISCNSLHVSSFFAGIRPLVFHFSNSPPGRTRIFLFQENIFFPVSFQKNKIQTDLLQEIFILTF